MDLFSTYSISIDIILFTWLLLSGAVMNVHLFSKELMVNWRDFGILNLSWKFVQFYFCVAVVVVLYYILQV
jgi:hypothetical protein